MNSLFKFLIIIIFLIFGDTAEVTYLRKVPRLGNTSYWDFYFSCSTVGQTLQWEVNGDRLGGFLTGEVARILSSSRPNFNYTATLLLSQQNGEQNSLYSVLIVSLNEDSNLNVVCGNGMLSNRTYTAQSKMKMANMSMGSIFLQNLLIEGIDNSIANIFICGVNDEYMLWETDNVTFPFFSPNNIGQERNVRQQNNTAVKLQVIYIAQIPYKIVSVLIAVTGSSLTYVQCANSEHSLRFQLNSISEETTTEIMAGSVTTLFSTLTTIIETASTESTNGTLLAKIVFPSVAVILVIGFSITMVAVCIALCFRKKSMSREITTENISLSELEESPLRENNFNEIKEENPLRENNFNEIKESKKIEKTDYYSFCEQVQFIFINMNQNVFNAATTFIKTPVKENGDIMAQLDDHIYIGMLKYHPVGLVRDETGENCEEMLTSAIKNYFPNAKYILNVGVCYSFDREKTHLADVLISKKIIGATIKEDGDYITSQEKMSVAIKRLFCKDIQKVTGLEVAKGRKAKHYVVKFGSSVSIIKNENITSILQNVDGICGCDKVGQQLVNLQKNGIKMPDESKKDVQVIIINGVTGFKDDDKGRVWDFIAAQAAFHYVAAKLEVYKTSKEKPIKENRSDEIKKLKPKKEKTDYYSFCERVRFIFINMNQNVLNAATTVIKAPVKEDGGDIMAELDDHIYIGMLECHPVGVVRDETGENCEEMLTSAIKDYFPNAKYILNVGVCYSFDPIKTDFADVLVSNKIIGAIAQNEGQHITSIEMSSEIKQLFCTNPNEVDGLEVAVGGRRAKHLVVAFASSVDITQNEDIVNILESFDETCGIDKVGQQLLNLQRNGIRISDNNFKKVQVAIINGVTGFLDYNMDRAWDFIAAKAAFHYTANKLKIMSSL